MSFNPLEHKGIPMEKQLRNWSELAVRPYDKHSVDPYTRTRIITMNGIEVENVFFSHQFARHTADMDIRQYLALTRRIEQQQQKAITALIPGEKEESVLEHTIGYEQVAVDLTAFLAQTEPDPYIKQTLEFGLLEDFDHLYRYANLLDLLYGKKAEGIVDQLTEVMPGRPTIAEHRHPYDDVRTPMDAKTSSPLSVLHVLTILSAEQQTMNFYMTVGNRPMDPMARSLYQEIAQIEEQHVTQYESLLDPTSSWWEQEVWHHYNECYLYHSFMNQEEDYRIRALWELHLAMELEHLRLSCEMLRKHENREPAEFLPTSLPDPVRFQSNKAYIRDVLARQVGLTARGSAYVPLTELPSDHRYFEYQKIVNSGDIVPSEAVIQQEIQTKGEDYRIETEGPHPVPALRRAEERVGAATR